jgi:hypothetical protein
MNAFRAILYGCAVICAALSLGYRYGDTPINEYLSILYSIWWMAAGVFCAVIGNAIPKKLK